MRNRINPKQILETAEKRFVSDAEIALISTGNWSELSLPIPSGSGMWEAHNYDIDGASFWYINTVGHATWTLTGIQAGYSGQILDIHVNQGAVGVTAYHNDSRSDAANRLHFADGTNHNFTTMRLRYSAVLSRWLVLSYTPTADVGGVWGSISGDISTQTDLQTAIANSAETATTIGALINAATEKTTAVDADAFALMDSAALNVVKKFTWQNIKATLKTYFDTLYQAVLVSGTSIKTINGTSLLGSGDITISASGAETVHAAGSSSVDFSTGGIQTLNVSTSTAAITVANCTSGKAHTIIITNSYAGATTVSFPSTHNAPASTLAIPQSKKCIVMVVYDGTSYYWSFGSFMAVI